MDKKEQLKELLLKNSHPVTWNIKICSIDCCAQQTVNPWRWKWVLMLDIWRCNIKSYQAVDLEANKLDIWYNELEKIFNPKK